MNSLIRPIMLMLIMGITVFISACNQNQTETSTVPETPEVAQNDHAHAPGTPPHSHSAQMTGEDWVELEQYRFRLSPEIGVNGETHLDLYIHDAKEQHVPDAKALVHLTAVDGHKLSVNLAEDKAGGHYAGKTTLEDMGEYQAVAQVTVDGNQLNPRFSFSRNQ